MAHVARIEGIRVDQLDLSTSRSFDYGPGVRVRDAKYSTSKSRAGFEYLFDATCFSKESAHAWLDQKGVRAAAFFSDGEITPCADDEIEMEVLKPGVYVSGKNGELKVSENDIELAYTNTQMLLDQGRLNSPGKLGHDPNQSPLKNLFPSGGAPAVGWLKSLRLDAGHSLVARYGSVPAKFKEWLSQKLYGPRSVELDMRFPDERGGEITHVLTGLAWLGAQRPAIQSLRQKIEGVEMSALSFDGLEDHVVEIQLDGENIESEHEEGVLPDGSTAKLDDDGGAGALPDTAQDPAQDAGKGSTMDPELVALQARVKAAEETAENERKARLSEKKARVTHRVTALSGVRLEPGEVETMIDTALHLDGGTLDGFLDSLERRPKIDNKTAPITLSGQGTEGKPGDGKKLKGEDKLMADAQALMRDPERRREYEDRHLLGKRMTLGDALCFAGAEDPEADLEYARSYGLTKASRPSDEGGN